MKKPLVAAVMAMAALAFGMTAHASMNSNPGMQMVEIENYAGALAYFQAVLQKNPQDAEAAAGLATISVAEGRNKAGVEWAREAVALAPDNAVYRMLLGIAYGQYIHDVSVFSQLGMAYKVRDAFRDAVQIDPGNSKARMGLAKYYILAPGIAGGSLEKAHRQISALDRIDPVRAAEVRATLAMEKKDYPAAESELRTAAALDKSGDADYQLGLFLLDRGRYADAFNAFQAGIGKNPDYSVNYYEAGQAAALGKINVEQGIRDLQKFLILPHDWLPGTPTYKQAHYQLGMLYALVGDKLNEKAQYVAALNLDPQYKPAKDALASVSASASL